MGEQDGGRCSTRGEAESPVLACCLLGSTKEVGGRCSGAVNQSKITLYFHRADPSTFPQALFSACGNVAQKKAGSTVWKIKGFDDSDHETTLADVLFLVSTPRCSTLWVRPAGRCWGAPRPHWLFPFCSSSSITSSQPAIRLLAGWVGVLLSATKYNP